MICFAFLSEFRRCARLPERLVLPRPLASWLLLVLSCTFLLCLGRSVLFTYLFPALSGRVRNVLLFALRFPDGFRMFSFIFGLLTCGCCLATAASLHPSLVRMVSFIWGCSHVAVVWPQQPPFPYFWAAPMWLLPGRSSLPPPFPGANGSL